MTAVHGVLYICAYFLGLLSSALESSILGLPVGAIALLGLGCLAAIALPRYWRSGLGFKGWLLFGLIGCVAVVYAQWRSPQPSATDISQLLSPTSPILAVEVDGQLESAPRQTRSANKQVWVRVVQAKMLADDSGNADSGEGVQSGKLYVTLPAAQAEQLEPGQGVRLTGRLYAPQPATNPGSFDFRKFLAQQGCFAGLRAEQVTPLSDWPPNFWWGLRGRVNQRLWQARQRIVGAFEQGLNRSTPPSDDPLEALNHRGTLLSSMVLGRKAVDLPPEIADAFARAGMAHTLAASGFHVSLLLGLVLWCTRRLTPSRQAWIGGGVLLGYIGLTGLQPSVLRAGLMGGGALLGRVYEQKLRPVGVLLMVAFVLLLINPLWIFHLGFQMSFLATLGLLVTAPPLTRRLDWLPSSVATMIAIPISAYLWTLPVQLFAFGTVSTYSIGVNILLTLVVVFTSLGGMVCGAIALIHPDLGAWGVQLLAFPTQILIIGVTRANALPGSLYAVGTISILQLMALYGLLIGGWVLGERQTSQGRPPSWITPGMISVGAIALIFIPARMSALTQPPVTFLNTGQQSAVVIQHHGEVGLIHTARASDLQFTLIPFLHQQGINRIDWAIATPGIPHSDLAQDFANRWSTLTQRIPIADLWLPPALSNVPLPGVQSQKLLEPPHSTPVGSIQVQLLSLQPEVMHLEMGDRTWLRVHAWDEQQIPKLLELSRQAPPDVLQWSGMPLPVEVVEALQPKAIVATGRHALERFTNHPSTLPMYQTDEQGAVQWQGDRQFSPIFERLQTD
jgi:competence protein ComEC